MAIWTNGVDNKSIYAQIRLMMPKTCHYQDITKQIVEGIEKWS